MRLNEIIEKGVDNGDTVRWLDILPYRKSISTYVKETSFTHLALFVPTDSWGCYGFICDAGNLYETIQRYLTDLVELHEIEDEIEIMEANIILI